MLEKCTMLVVQDSKSFDTPSLSDNNDSNSSSDNEVEEEAVC